MKKIYLVLIVVFLCCFTGISYAQTTSFTYTGSMQTYTVPAGFSSLTIDMAGAQGGTYPSFGVGGLGGRVQATLAVTLGEVLYIYVGQVGTNGACCGGTIPAGGSNSGGGAIGGTGSNSDGGAAGGGSTDIRLVSGSTGTYGVTSTPLGSRLIVAGGGGGGSWNCGEEDGGTGGYPAGGTGNSCDPGSPWSPTNGGSQTAGGPAEGGSPATAGGFGPGGNAAPSNYGGGGGGGWYGGGGCVNGSGGGGSSYYGGAGVTLISTTSGFQSGNGYVYISPPPCNAIGAITGTTTVCQGSTTTLADATHGGVGTWYSNNTAVATVNSSTGVVTGVSPGTAKITDSVATPCGGSSATTTVTVLPVPAAIGGSLSVCMGSTTTLTNSVSSGTWTSSNTAVGTIGSSSGVLTPITTGTTTVTYNLGNGCATATAIATVNPLPAAIGGTTVVCQGSTVTLTDGTSGGTWSTVSATATVVGSTGVVTGVSGGNATISYTLPAGCFVTQVVTVNADAPIAGTSSVCNGYTTTLSDATTGGGTWNSSNTSVATINSSGLVTGLLVGPTTISFTATTTACVTTFSFNVIAPPTAYTVTGGGAYCAGSTGVTIGVNNSAGGVPYTLFDGATRIIPDVSSTLGGAISFGPQTASGTYYVVAGYGTACATTMLGSAIVTINPLPTAYSLTGGGTYCVGGTGVAVGLNPSAIGINYQLYANGTPVGSAVAGTGGAISFGNQTTVGSYTVIGTNGTTSCSQAMTGSVTVGTNVLPTAFSVTESAGSYCVGGAGVAISLSGSFAGTNYQLYIGGIPTGSPVAGSGSPISFGNQTAAGTYTVIATNTASGCTNSMSGSAVVTINSLPTAYTITQTSGTSYCLGGAGVPIGLNGSATGVNYQLYLGITPVGAPVAGTGAAISFGNQTTVGSYTIVATNTTTGCVNNMTGSGTVATNPLPSVFGLTGGGGYCAGGAGVPVGLANSQTGVGYQLYNGSTLTGAGTGSGGAINFGTFTAAGTYTVVATTTATGCTSNMSGGVTVVINPLPAIFTVNEVGTGNYCAGGTGVAVGLSNSVSGINYQLYNGVATAGSVVGGTGSAISFGLQTAAGSYTAVAINPVTGCTSNMTGSALVSINPLPALYTLTGGGGYCSGSTGVVIGLSASNTGITYQLYNTAGAVGSALAGTGTAISFGLQTTASTRDSVVATNVGTGCSSVMSGNVPVSIIGLPTPYSVTGGGNYCAGGTGVTINLGGSATGTNYQVFNGSTPVGIPIAGTGSPLVFGPETAMGTYTIVAVSTATSCTNNMPGSASVVVNALPAVFSVTGGGTYCAGTGGRHVGLGASVTGVNYQLYNSGLPVGALVAGNGLPLDFGLWTTGGTYTAVAITPGTSCQSTMSGSVNITVNPLPGLYTITGGGSYCAGGAGKDIGLTGSATGITYQLMNGGLPAGGPVSGTGIALDFGLQTANGIYTVVATNSTTGCFTTMTGSAPIAANSLPAVHMINGGGNYCPGGTGVAIGLNGSNAGINYQLYNGTSAAGTPVPGTGLPVSFGLQTAPGVYTIAANNPATSCVSNMTGSVTVGTYPLPTVFNVTGGGNYCSGGTGVTTGLSGSSIGVLYQLFNASAPIGAPLLGTGASLNFGLQTGVGTYSIVATNATTSCSSNMSGSVTVGIAPLPTVHNVTGGGNYCTGATGVHIGLNGSDIGINYQPVVLGNPAGAAVAGTGSAIDLGLETTTGTYTVMATNTATGCMNLMTGSAIVGISALPVAFTVSGGGAVCSGGTGASITLSGSDPSSTYQLYNGPTAVGTPMPGTGSSLSFSAVTAAGTYSVMATGPTGCTALMTGTASVGISALPTPFIVSGGGNYCAGGTGVHILLSGSNTGISYALFVSGIPTGTVIAGTGSSLDFGLQTAAGPYTAVATNTVLGCTNNMLGSANIVINPLPDIYTASSTSSSYCAGGTGVQILLSGSDLGVNYQLYNGPASIGSAMPGSGSAMSFGFVTLSGSYTLEATNTITGCSVNMSPNVSVAINPLPTVYTITGGGQYCSGGAGAHIGLNNSNAGVTYQLYLSGSAVAGSSVNGTGSAIDFGLQTGAGSYTVIASNNTTTCSSNMSGTATVIVNPLPVGYTVTGGGNYCAGSAGVAVGLSGSGLGIHYQLMNGATAVGSALSGTGTAISFGMQTGAGTYTVMATSAVTGCAGTMTGAATIGINPAPVAYAVTGGGNICPGSGVTVGVSGSDGGVTYQLYNGSSSTGSGIAGTGAGISLGTETMAGSYTVRASDDATGCTSTMTGSATVVINPVPTVYNIVGGGNYCTGGAGVHIGLSNSADGINYTLYSGTISHGSLPGTGAPLDFGMLTSAGIYWVHAINATTGCSDSMSGSAVVAINPMVTPLVSISAAGGSDTVCAGNFVTFTAVTVNGGTPTYQWTVNGAIAGAGSTYSYMPANGDVVGITIASTANCAIPVTASNSMVMTVDPKQLPVVTITADPGTEVCRGTAVTFTAAPSYGGSSPTYTWITGSTTLSTSPSFSYIPANGDDVYCIMTSNYLCRLANTATSSRLDMTVDVPTLPVVTINAQPGTTIALGETVTLSATVADAGPSPSYQWLVNGNPVPGATGPTYTNSDFANLDSITCQVLSSGGCSGLLGFNSVTIHIGNVGVKPVTASGSNITLVPNPNKGTFTIKGSLGSVSDEDVTVEVVNMIGQVIYNQGAKAHSGVINETIQLNSSLANGMYLLNLRSENGNEVFHFVIEQ